MKQSAVHLCSATVEFMGKGRIAYPATINDEGMYNLAKTIGQDLLGKGNVRENPMTMAAEDFSFYGKRMPSALFFIGINGDSQKNAYPLHSPYFNLDEEALPIGAAFHAAVAMTYLNNPLPAGVNIELPAAVNYI